MVGTVATLPERAGSRIEAQELLRTLGPDLAGRDVRLDGHFLVAGSSSFIDELVKEVLEVRGARRLELDGVTARAAAFAQSSATRRGVADRLGAVVRP